MRDRPMLLGLPLALVVSLLLVGGGVSQAVVCPPGQPPGRPPGQPPTAAPGQPEGRPPGSPDYGPGSCALLLSTTTGSPGTPFTVSGAGFGATSDVGLIFNSDPVSLGTVQADSSGTFAKNVVVPAGVAPGQHHVTASGVDPQGNPRTLVAGFFVTGDPPASSAPGAAGGAGGNADEGADDALDLGVSGALAPGAHEEAAAPTSGGGGEGSDGSGLRGWLLATLAVVLGLGGSGAAYATRHRRTTGA